MQTHANKKKLPTQFTQTTYAHSHVPILYLSARAIKESLKDLKEEAKKETKKGDESPPTDDGFAMMPTTRKKLLDTLEKGKAALKRLDEIFAARQTANAHQLPGLG